MKKYDHLKIEKKWQKEWENKKVYKTFYSKTAKSKKLKPFYVLDMFPYPSGVGLHVGHPRGYIGSDVYARMKRMQGYNVLHPMGFDSFGLPAEQYAIKTGKNPGPFTDQLCKSYKKQLESIGFSFDWSRRVATHEQDYYKWTQWIFLKLYEYYYDDKLGKARPISGLIKKFEKEDKNWKNYNELEKQNILMGHRIAYEGYAEVNWCNELGTVLANDEILDGPNGTLISERGGHPVEKKIMRQWFMRITAYADRLISGFDTINWPENVKEIQKNWIGKSDGSEIDFVVQNSEEKIKVFTTRADTLFGVTYVVLAPDHELVQKLKSKIQNWDEVEKYILNFKNKPEENRSKNDKEKTGVELKGVKAINPANGEEVPVWIADYVLASYGTGAVMAVPAHDERDFEFANKYELPIKQVIVPQDSFKSIAISSTLKDAEFFKKQLKEKGIKFELATSIISNREHIHVQFEQELLQDFIKLVQNQITSTNWVEIMGTENLVVQTNDVHKDFLSESDRWFKKFSEWEPHVRGQRSLWDMLGKNPFLKEFVCYTDNGILKQSKSFNGMTSEEAKRKITEFVGGKIVTKYKMRDAIFARQRYWGEPIPLYRDKEGIIHEVKKLPLELPKVKSYEPTGFAEGPLAGVKAWVAKGYETNTMPGWAGSSWYFLRYMDPKNKKELASKKELDYWKQVDVYVGGAEHATGHLLYSRFWHKFLKDIGVVKTEEPFHELHNQGMIGGPDGRKMSKRWGNVINPDDVVKTYGADSLRVFEMFLGPFDSSLPWSTEGIIGSRRFIEKVWRMTEKVSKKEKTSASLDKLLHKTIKKVTEDIASFNFNTAISSMMIFMNELEKSDQIFIADFKLFLGILAPFAPHVAEDLWKNFGEKKSIHISPWPKYDKNKIVDDEVTIAIQVNGKVRAEIIIPIDSTEAFVKEKAENDPAVLKWTEGKKIARFIYVKNKLVNIVVI